LRSAWALRRTSKGPLHATNYDIWRLLFYRDAATNQWSERKQLLPHDTVEFFTFGQALAVDGDTIAITVPSGTLNSVSQEAGVYLFGRHEGGPDQWGGIIKITDPIANAGGVFASSVALAGDLLFVGAVSASADGMVMIFERDRGGPNMWGKIATILESDLGSAKGTDEAFGAAVAVDGDNLLIGAPPDRNTINLTLNRGHRHRRIEDQHVGPKVRRTTGTRSIGRIGRTRRIGSGLHRGIPVGDVGVPAVLPTRSATGGAAARAW
jgi:hypothetical protein